MRSVRMKVFPAPSLRSRSVIASEVAPAITGEGDVNYECGGCGAVLAARMSVGQLQLVGFKCPTCGTFSEPPDEGAVGLGGGVFFPAGIYRITETLKAYSNVWMKGERRD